MSLGYLRDEGVDVFSSAALCDVCGKPFTENLEWIGPKRRRTRVFKKHVYERVKNKIPQKQMALHEKPHEAMVLDIFKRQAKRAACRIDDRRRGRVLGVDEIWLRKRHKQSTLVLSELERCSVIAILPNKGRSHNKRNTA